MHAFLVVAKLFVESGGKEGHRTGATANDKLLALFD